jgi:subtilase family serine protease
MNLSIKKEVVHTGAAGRWSAMWLCVVVTLIACTALPAFAASGNYILHNTPKFAATSKNLGVADPSQVIEVSLWLNPHNRSLMDEMAHQLYDPSSPNYRHFLNRSQFTARFAPSPQEAKTVQQFLEAHGLKVVRTGPDNFFVRASGTVAEVEAAFQVQINRYQVGDQVIRSNDRDPFIDGDAASLVRSIGGLDNMQYHHPAKSRTALTQPKGETAAAALAAQPASSSFYNNDCFPGTETETFSTSNDGSFPIGTYKGNILNLQSLTSAGCGYTPPMIAAAYNLKSLYKAGLDGTGQTIALIEGCGSPTIQHDANVFSAKFGLPPLTSSNFFITYVPSPSFCASPDAEINIDVEWAHAIAPGANLALVVGTGGSFEDLNEAEFTTINYGLATVLSGSYGLPEPFLPTSFLETLDLISESAALVGISADFSSGDAGDFTADGLPPTVIAPADSPWSTAVGGVSLALNADNSIAWQAGWGNNQTLLTEEGTIFPLSGPLAEIFGFIGGSGGGASNCVAQNINTTTGEETCLGGYTKPSFQSGLPGPTRQLPDVSWLADPYTGAVIAISIPGQVPETVWQVYGGTSVACPMFSGLWAIANQAAGTPLGQAAPYLYSLPAGAITDIVPVGGTHNVAASIKQSATVTDTYDPNAVLGGGAAGKFISAIWDYPTYEDTTFVISFDTDCTAGPTYGVITACTSPSSLRTKVGWDNVTGLGVPNGQAFVDAFTPPAAAVKK